MAMDAKEFGERYLGGPKEKTLPTKEQVAAALKTTLEEQIASQKKAYFQETNAQKARIAELEKSLV